MGHNDGGLSTLTGSWGSQDSVNLYLGRCQVDTPYSLVRKVWKHVRSRREKIPLVVDFGAGDGRFADSDLYQRYIGYEIDGKRCAASRLTANAHLVNKCAFSEARNDADLCVGNPPYVRNQDLPRNWRQEVSRSLQQRTGIALSGLANAWQYFFLLAIASTKPDGMIALVIPYEWVSRPSAQAIRDFIRRAQWGVQVYRLRDDTFDRVLTTSSITIVDKRQAHGQWQYFEETSGGQYRELPSETYGKSGVVAYSSRPSATDYGIFAKRGLSPGTQEVLVLTEGERVRSGLKIGTDVVPCVTSLRPIGIDCHALSKEVFVSQYRHAGQKCWLIRTDREPTTGLSIYLANVPEDRYQTATCLERDIWWKFTMPSVPALLSAMGFRQDAPKTVVNTIGARAVGAVAGIYGVPDRGCYPLAQELRSLRLTGRIVSHSNGLKKIEINQLNTLLQAASKRILSK